MNKVWSESIDWRVENVKNGDGNGNQLQYSCLGNPMDRGARQATVHGVAEELDMN